MEGKGGGSLYHWRRPARAVKSIFGYLIDASASMTGWAFDVMCALCHRQTHLAFPTHARVTAVVSNLVGTATATNASVTEVISEETAPFVSYIEQFVLNGNFYKKFQRNRH